MTQIDQSSTDLKVLNELVIEASLVLSDGNVTFGEIVRLGGILAGKVNQLAHLSGQQKKELVIKSVEEGLKLVLDLKRASLPDDFEKKIFDAASFAKETLPVVLDLACDVAKGKLDLKKPAVKNTCFSLASLLFRCIKAPIPVEPLVVAVPLAIPVPLVDVKEEQKLQTSTDHESKQILEVAEQVSETRSASTVTE